MIVFESSHEVIVTTAAPIADFIREWFIEGGRLLEDYEVYEVEANQGFSFTTSIESDGRGTPTQAVSEATMQRWFNEASE